MLVLHGLESRIGSEVEENSKTLLNTYRFNEYRILKKYTEIINKK